MKTSRFFRHKNYQSGYTLMEMIIVLTIIGLLTAMAIYSLTGVTDSAKIQKAQNDVLAFKEMLAAYELDNQVLPTTDQGIKALWARPTAEPIPPRWRAYLDHEVLDPWGHSYQYRNPGKHNPNKYDVFSLGPDGQPDTDDDIGNWVATPSSP